VLELWITLCLLLCTLHYNACTLTGAVQNKRLFVDFGALDNTAVNDVDGIRTDLAGRVYIVRNGGWQIAVFSKEGELLQRIHTNMRSVVLQFLSNFSQL
jgi:sugar lactone lactonase YvrE